MSTLSAGAARVKLEPPAGLAMLGYGNRVGRNAGVHDDLAAQALVLSDGASKIAIVGVDLLALGVRIADDIRERAAASTGIPADSIVVCATHTHSAPAFNIFATPRSDARPADGRNLAWERALPGKIAKSPLLQFLARSFSPACSTFPARPPDFPFVAQSPPPSSMSMR